MKLTKKDFECVINGRVEEEMRRAKAGWLNIYFVVGALIAGLLIMCWLSTVGGLVLFLVCCGISIFLSRRRARRVAQEIRQGLMKEWEGFIDV